MQRTTSSRWTAPWIARWLSIYATRARAQATSLNRIARYDEVRTVLEQTAARIPSFAGDPALHRLAAELRREMRRFVVAMDAITAETQFRRAHG